MERKDVVRRLVATFLSYHFSIHSRYIKLLNYKNNQKYSFIFLYIFTFPARSIMPCLHLIAYIVFHQGSVAYTGFVQANSCKYKTHEVLSKNHEL